MDHKARSAVAAVQSINPAEQRRRAVLKQQATSPMNTGSRLCPPARHGQWVRPDASTRGTRRLLGAGMDWHGIHYSTADALGPLPPRGDDFFPASVAENLFVGGGIFGARQDAAEAEPLLGSCFSAVVSPRLCR
jgi:hypothetical protein